MPSFDLSLTLDEISALIKSASISLSVSAKKLADMNPGRTRDNEKENYRNLSAAMEELRSIEEEALLS